MRIVVHRTKLIDPAKLMVECLPDIQSLIRARGLEINHVTMVIAPRPEEDANRFCARSWQDNPCSFYTQHNAVTCRGHTSCEFRIVLLLVAKFKSRVKIIFYLTGLTGIKIVRFLSYIHHLNTRLINMLR